MDNLSLRRALYEDPNSINASALQDEPQLQQLQQELLALDAELKQQLHIDVPTELTEKILLRQSMLPVIKPWYQRPLPYATAAAILVSVLYWQAPNPVLPADLGQHALSHVYHELAALKATVALNDTDLQPLFTELGISANLPVPVRYARFCDFEGIRSLHLVLEIDGQPLTLFVVPDEVALDKNTKTQFADARFFGEAITFSSHRLLLVAEQPQLLARAGSMLEKSLKINI